MAFTQVMLKNDITGHVKAAPVGFSWTACFFGAFPALFRGDFAAFFLLMICTLVASMLPALALIFAAYLAAIYNRNYIARMLAKGYRLTGADEALTQYHGLTDPGVGFRGHERANFFKVIVFVVVIAGLIFVAATGA